MNNWIVITLLGCITLFIIYIVYSRFSASAKPSKQADKANTPPSHPYHAVSIKPGTPACSAVMQIRDERYLAKQAKRFPLPECTQSQCHCTYQHHADRRRGDDRRHESVVMKGLYVDNEKRHKKDRRKTHYEMGLSQH